MIMTPSTKRATWTLLFIGFAAFGQSGSVPTPPPGKSASDRDCPEKAKPIMMELKDTGEIVEGSACVGVRLNGLRYSSEFGRAVTYTAGPNLSGTLASAPAAGGAAATLDASTDDIKNQYKTLLNAWLPISTMNDLATAEVNKAINMLSALVSESDDIFRTNGAQGVLSATKDAQLKTARDVASRASWKAADQYVTAFKSLQITVSMRLMANPSDADRAVLTAIQTGITSELTDLAPSTLAGEKTAAFGKQQAIVNYWNRIIDTMELSGFERKTYVTCGVSFNQNKQIAIRLYLADRSASFTSQPVVLSDAKDPFVTVNCSSPFVVSAGVEIRFLKTSTYGLVPSGATGANQFGITENNDRTPLPVAMAHVRLGEDKAHRFAMLASVGVAAHSQGSGTAGSAAEYLTGLSLGLFRTMFITAGVHFGKVSALGGGYRVGDPVPAGVTTVPVTGSYKAGFGLAITFTKP